MKTKNHNVIPKVKVNNTDTDIVKGKNVKKIENGQSSEIKLHLLCGKIEVYEDCVSKNSHAGKYSNKKIEIYDEMAIVFGKDIATGILAKSFVDVEDDDDMTGESSNDIDHGIDETTGKLLASARALSSQKSSYK